MRFVVRAAVWITCLVALTPACQQKQSPLAAKASYQVRVSALVQAGALTQTGKSFTRVCSPSSRDIPLTMVEAENGPASLQNVDNGRADIAFVGANLLYEGYRGVVAEYPERFEKINGLAIVQPFVEHVLVGPRSTVSSLKDLAGRTVAVGRTGSTNAITAPKLLAAADLARPAHGIQSDFGIAIANLFDGTVDAVMLPAPVPSPLVTRAVIRGARLVEIRGPLADRLRERVRFMHPYTIPPDTYPGQHTRVVTLGMDTVIVVRRALPNWVAQRLVGVLFECLPRLAAIDPSFQMVDVSRMPATPVPLHPGAVLYYRQRELAP